MPLSFINIIIAFLSGFLTFFAGCLAPIVPVYISFLAGSQGESLHRPSQRLRWKVFGNSLLFVAGFIGVFALFSLTVNSFSRALAPYRKFLQVIAGVVVLFFGIQLTGIVRFLFVYKERKFRLNNMKPGHPASALLLGAVLGFSWTPCIGPVLAAILIWAASFETLGQALTLMLAFSIGLALPFVIIGLLFDKVLTSVKKITRYAQKIQVISGVLLAIMGILLITGHFATLSVFFLKIFGSAAFVVEFR